VLQRASLFRQLVFHAHRRFRNHDPGQDAFGFELPQTLRQHAIADVRNRAPQLGEAHPSIQQELDHGSRPAAADELDRAVEPDAEVGFETHACSLAEYPT
jgi:hypothetical protein